MVRGFTSESELSQKLLENIESQKFKGAGDGREFDLSMNQVMERQERMTKELESCKEQRKLMNIFILVFFFSAYGLLSYLHP
mmetsp:Transcript_1993/g.3516  ORF Transcript_1993/g.3516 Transcript_1993/m.3516 type:complete len:82 (+) Transcript_1993:492-737(+)